jgi:hypothetical protein
MGQDGFFGDFAKDALSRQGCEIGSHPHPWSSPPDYKLTSDDIKFHPYLIEYPVQIMREKIKAITELLENRFGKKVYSHRAGRWAFNQVYAKILCEFGYKVDCSVTPFVKLNAEKRPVNEPQSPVVDYTDAPQHAYFLNSRDVSKGGELPLLEIPMTTMPYYGKVLSAIYGMIPDGICLYAFRAIFGRPVNWFRPHSYHQEMFRVAMHRLNSGADYIMFMLHSSELMPGANPVFKNKRQIERMYETIEQVFGFLKDNKVKGATCSQYYEIFESQGGGFKK